MHLLRNIILIFTFNTADIYINKQMENNRAMLIYNKYCPYAQHNNLLELVAADLFNISFSGHSQKFACLLPFFIT